jgi:hypothetical protein
MMKDIVEFINTCELCQQMKDPPARRTRVPFLTPPHPSRPWEVASMDVMHLPSAFPLHTVNGFVKQLLCDKSSSFSAVLKEGIKLSPFSEYHPEANRVAESKVKALKDLLRALAFNARLDEEMKHVFQLVKKNLEDRQSKLFVTSDSLPNYFEIGHSVLYYNPIVPEGKHPKFHNYWQRPVVYKIQKEDDLNDIRRAHVARLKRRFVRREKQKAFKSTQASSAQSVGTVSR